ncbi:hypothetical protein PG994_002698 [Apiospora phragmitis]|uniref:Uncharacterized protein n=1 Tax=Apiospora phragmitis TaxID=2905665 RepID=A0ABR1W8N1_9PEZI
MDAERLNWELNRAQQDAQLERQHRTRLEAELREKDQEAKRIRTQWRQTAVELNRLKVQERGPGGAEQMTDRDVVDRVELLRYEVRSFAFQHFDSPQLSEARIEAALGPLQRRVRLPPHKLRTYLVSSSRRHLIIRAFIWLVLVDYVFEGFEWAGGQAARAMRIMADTVYPHDGSSEEMRKYRRWLVGTSSLLPDARDTKQTTGDSRGRMAWFDGIVDMIYRPIEPLSRSPANQLWSQLSTMVHQFLDLDRLLAMQVAGYDWFMGSMEKVDMFSENSMTLDEGEQLEAEAPTVALVLAPGLEKYGKSTGKYYDHSMQLLKTEVSCRLVRRPRNETTENTRSPSKIRDLYDTFRPARW